MEVVATRDDLRKATEAARSAGRRVGLVPTMGALHRGHVSLFEVARAGCDLVVATVFVNPLQFGSADDLEKYPRNCSGDLAVASDAGVDVVFAPSVDEMYPTGSPSTTVQPGAMADRLEGASRPGHFAGVATVVTKLFSLVGPSRAFLGEKDFQQLVIVRRLVADLELPIEIIGCPTVREEDGLACSSRNARLSRAERAAAPVLSRALWAASAVMAVGVSDPQKIEWCMHEVMCEEKLAVVDYAVVVDPNSLERPSMIEGEVRLLIAANFGAVRLIDNLGARARP